MSVVLPVNAQSPTPTPEAPPGFRLIDSGRGVWLFRKDYAGGNPDFVQLVDLDAGARLEFMHGEITDPRPLKGVYGGADPRMTSLPIQTFWDRLRQTDEDAFCLTNGQFFYMPEYPTRLAFPLKIQGEIITDGWGIDTYLDQKLILELWDDRAAIVPLNEDSLLRSTAPDLIGGLTEEANKRAKYSVGRTFFGVDDRDGDGFAETVLVFSTLSAKQEAAAETLRSFGADQVMMLDGGGSTQLICQSGYWIQTDRPVPQVIGVVAAEPPPVSSRLIGHTNWTVVVGEKLPLEIQIQNTGVLSWTPSSTTFIIKAGRLELEDNQTPEEIVPPGVSTTIHQSIALPQQKGVSPVEIRLAIEHADVIYPIEPFTVDTIVLPYQLQQRKRDLQTQLGSWIASKPEQTADLATEWIEQQLRNPAAPLEIQEVNQIRPVDATLVPLLMLPIMALIAWAIARAKR